MTDTILLTGTRGEGKTLAAVKMAMRYIKQGRKVATNIDLNVEAMTEPWHKIPLFYRIPDYPDLYSLKALPEGNPDKYNESKNGLLIFDETASYLNSRAWNDDKKDRLQVISWVSQSRKDGWDVIFLAQVETMLDSQLRGMCDVHGRMRNVGKFDVPFLSTISKWFFDVPIKLPKFHVASFHYGFGKSAPTAWRDMFGGAELYKCYDTLQKLDPTGETGAIATYTVLPHWYTRGRYMRFWEMYGRIAFGFFFIGSVIGSSGHWAYQKLKPEHVSVAAIKSAPAKTIPDYEKTVSVSSVITSGNGFTLILSDGTLQSGTDYIINQDGKFYKAGSKWYKKEEGAL